MDIALQIEQNINLILLTYLSIENDERKAITNKSGNLSFKNKIDLLFDLEIINKDEHKQFPLLMEFRNQFLHNIECNSFAIAITHLGLEKEKSLLKFDDKILECDKEFRYKSAYKNLFISSMKICLNKIKIRKQIILDKSKLFNTLLSNSTYLIDSFFDLIEKLFVLYEIQDSDSSDVIKLKMQIFETISLEIGKINRTEEYKNLQNQIHNSLSPTKLKAYFK